MIETLQHFPARQAPEDNPRIDFALLVNDLTERIRKTVRYQHFRRSVRHRLSSQYESNSRTNFFIQARHGRKIKLITP